MSELYTTAVQLLRRAVNSPHADFRFGQWEAIEQLLIPGTRLLVVQRTGWGKSLVYFITTRILRDRGRGPTLLISPLLALMRNQIAAAQRLGLQAATINSTNSGQWQQIQHQVLANEIDILLISPERLANEEFRENILVPLSERIGFFVVDEAHCISDWGHDFRPDYRRIVRILQALPPTISVLTTTATANDRVINDVQAQLGQDVRIVRGALNRPSLQLQTISLPSQASRLAWLAHHLPTLPGSGIIYTLTVRDAEQVAEWLQSQDIQAEAYSGKMQGDRREDLEHQLLNNQIKALVATSALGMGFDKPDLGFVIHYQRPGSVVHYYQQVGRAGRAVDQAYGILLSGNEDETITHYFIQTAFPPDRHVESVLEALNQADDGLSISQLEAVVNLSRQQLNKVLKLLSVEIPSPITKLQNRWYANPISYRINRQKIEYLTQLRYREQARMQDYMTTSQCLMAFLATELDDRTLTHCGRCANCLQTPLIPATYPRSLAQTAVRFLRRNYQILTPRKRWAASGLLNSGWRGNTNIAVAYQAQEGRTLSLWGDDGWGSVVKQGKYRDLHLSDDLVTAALQLLVDWQPQPFPGWVTCVPSLERPNLVPSFADRLAQQLQIPFVPCVQKQRQNRPQKEMCNSAQQLRNLDGVFEVQSWPGMQHPVLLIDDVVDSGWTMTVVAALLKRAGSGAVFPLALALNSLSA